MTATLGAVGFVVVAALLVWRSRRSRRLHPQDVAFAACTAFGAGLGTPRAVRSRRIFPSVADDILSAWLQDFDRVDSQSEQLASRRSLAARPPRRCSRTVASLRTRPRPPLNAYIVMRLSEVTMKSVLVLGVRCVAALLVYRRTTGRQAAVPAAGGSARTAPGLPIPDSPYVRVFMSKDGALSVNGRGSSFAELSTALDEMVSTHGAVLYSRDSPEQFEPHPSAKAVIDAVIQRRLPIRFCRHADCSDAIDANGSSGLVNESK